MKLTKSMLKEMIKHELTEFTTTAGGTKAVQNIKTAKDTTVTKKDDRKKARQKRDTAKDALKAAEATYDAHLADEPSYRYIAQNKAGRSQYTNDNTTARPFGYGPWTERPAWTSWESDRSSKESDKTTKQSDYDTKVKQYSTKQKAFSDAEREEKMTKARTGFGFGAGAGGRAGGKGGTAKTAGETGTGEEGGEEEEKNESLFRILGRDFLNELNDLKKYKK
jgi:hypothetical protein